MAFVVKAKVADPNAPNFVFVEKTMYGGKDIAVGDEIFIFASDHMGGQGLCAKGVVTALEWLRPEKPAAKARIAPRIRIEVRCTAKAKRTLGRAELRPFIGGDPGRPETELAFRLYRQATNKIIGTSAAAFLAACF